MNFNERKALFDSTLRMLKPAIERIASDPVFRDRFELAPLQALDEMGVALYHEVRPARAESPRSKLGRPGMRGGFKSNRRPR